MQIAETGQWKVLGKNADDEWELREVDPKNEIYSELSSVKSPKVNSAKKKELIKIAEEVFESEYSNVTYSHQVLQGGIAHPDMSQVIPFMPEQICNNDGESKQDCGTPRGVYKPEVKVLTEKRYPPYSESSFELVEVTTRVKCKQSNQQAVGQPK